MEIICGLAALLCLSASAEAATKPQAKDYKFTVVKENPVTSVKDQNRSGTCWVFSTLSFLESEAIKLKNIKDTTLYPDFSEMFVVYKAYQDRADKYVRVGGKLGFSAGSGFGDALEVINNYGLISQSAYSGLNYGYDLPVQGEIDAVLKAYVDAIVQVSKSSRDGLTPVWKKGFEGILNGYFGPIPTEFDGYTLESYRDSYGIDASNYVNISSFTHHPFYTQFSVEVEDNWRGSTAYNLPLDEMMQVIDNAIDNGYTVLWGGDVSEKGFTRDGLGVLVGNEASNSGSDQARWVGAGDNKSNASDTAIWDEVPVTQESRQAEFDRMTTTDDHGMHIYGKAVDQNGNKYYLVKNSWGNAGEFKGIWYMSESYIKAKTINFVVNKNAVPKDIRKKAGIK